MRILIRYLALSLAVFLGFNLILPHWLPQTYPRNLGPKFSKAIRLDLQKPINDQRPQDILLGNSVIVNGLDGDLFQSLTGRITLPYAFNGAASAYYYLILKNIIITAQTKPEFILLFFIDNWLTRPDLMVSGGPYLQIMDEVAGDNETVLLHKAYINRLDPVVAYLDGHLMLFGERQTIKVKLDARLKYPLSDWFLNCGKVCLDTALDKAFFYDNMLQVADATNIYRDEWSGSEWDFPGRLTDSFLSDILGIARQNGIRLVFVREKNARFMTLEEETADMRRYFQDLATYLSAEGIPLLDFSHDPALGVELFHDQMHFTPQARPVFTRLVAEKFISEVLPAIQR
jgi:hypothetical protein